MFAGAVLDEGALACKHGASGRVAAEGHSQLWATALLPLPLVHCTGATMPLSMRCMQGCSLVNVPMTSAF